MHLATEIVRFFHIDVATASKSAVRTIEDFSRSRPGWYETLDLGETFQVCSALEREGYLVSAVSDSRHPVLGRAFVAPNFEERRATYGEYEFAADGFYRVREHFQHSVMPVVVEKRDGSPAVGTCFLAGNHRTVVTARHVIEKANKVDIKCTSGRPVKLHSLFVPKDDNLDVAVLCLAQDVVIETPFLRFDAPSVLDEVLCMGYPPIPGFDELQISDVTSINATLRTSRGRIVARGKPTLRSSNIC